MPTKKKPKTYAVERLLAMRDTAYGREYLVKWEGYSSAHDSWEPEKNINGQLIDDFHGVSEPAVVLEGERVEVELMCEDEEVEGVEGVDYFSVVGEEVVPAPEPEPALATRKRPRKGGVARLIAKAKAKAAEEARLIAEAEAKAKAIEEARLAAEAKAKAIEEARLAAEAEERATEEARLAAEAEAKATEEARLAAEAEAKATEEARLAAAIEELRERLAAAAGAAAAGAAPCKRPRGRAPKGKMWDTENGEWKDEEEKKNRCRTPGCHERHGHLGLCTKEDLVVQIQLKAEKQNAHSNFLQSVAFSPDGKTIVSGSWDNVSGSWDNTLKVWDAGASAL